jgi:hypothetical protein
VGGCTLEAIEAICETLSAETLPRLQPAAQLSALDAATALMDQSVLRQVEGPDGEPRFFMSETLREYAFESLTVGNELELMRQQHAGYFLRFVEALEPKLRGSEQEACLKRLDADYNNIRAALTWSCASDLEMALRMAAVLWEFWLARGYLTEGRIWLTEILSRSDAVAGLSARVRPGPQWRRFIGFCPGGSAGGHRLSPGKSAPVSGIGRSDGRSLGAQPFGPDSEPLRSAGAGSAGF